LVSQLEMSTECRSSEKAKQDGNEYFLKSDYSNAISCYTEAIQNALPQDKQVHIYYCNRATCHYHLGNYEKALHDASKSVEIYPNWVKVNFFGLRK
jgi:tetratricopeptide (TPR) repeat protein